MPYLTEKEYWGMLSNWKKIYFLIREYSLAILQPILFSALPAVIAYAVFLDKQNKEGYFYISVAALVILAAIWMLKRLSNIRGWMKWCPEPHLVFLYQEYLNQKEKKVTSWFPSTLAAIFASPLNAGSELTIQFHVDRAPLYMPSLARQHEYGLLALTAKSR